MPPRTGEKTNDQLRAPPRGERDGADTTLAVPAGQAAAAAGERTGLDCLFCSEVRVWAYRQTHKEAHKYARMI